MRKRGEACIRIIMLLRPPDEPGAARARPAEDPGTALCTARLARLSPAPLESHGWRGRMHATRCPWWSVRHLLVLPMLLTGDVRHRNGEPATSHASRLVAPCQRYQSSIDLTLLHVCYTPAQFASPSPRTKGEQHVGGPQVTRDRGKGGEARGSCLLFRRPFARNNNNACVRRPASPAEECYVDALRCDGPPPKDR